MNITKEAIKIFYISEVTKPLWMALICLQIQMIIILLVDLN